MRNKNSMKFFFLAAAVVAVVFSSGCVIQDYLSIFGSDVVKPSRTSSSIGASNVLVVSDSYTLPDKSAMPDMNVQLFVSIENKDTEVTKKAGGVSVDLYDAGVFKGIKDGKYVLCNIDSSYCQPDYCSKAEPCNMAAGSQKDIMFTLRSPTSDEIAGIITKSDMHFIVSYEYSGSSSYEVLVVDKDEIVRRQRAGETLSTNLNEIQGSGPIAVDIEQRIPYMITGSDGIIIFKIRDRGNGELKDSKITKGSLRIEFPAGLVPDINKNLEGDIERGGTTGKKCGTTPGYYCVSGEQMDECLEGTGLGIGPDFGCYEGEKCCVTCASKGNNCNGKQCSCTNNCIAGSREPQGRDCASGEKCCAAAEEQVGLYIIEDGLLEEKPFGCWDSSIADGKQQHYEEQTGCQINKGACVYPLSISPPYTDRCRSPATGAVTGMAASTSTFSCSESADKVVCVNNKDIALFKDESEPLWFKMVKVPELGGAPHKTYYINIYLDSYVYEIRDSVSVEVSPPNA